MSENKNTRAVASDHVRDEPIVIDAKLKHLAEEALEQLAPHSPAWVEHIRRYIRSLRPASDQGAVREALEKIVFEYERFCAEELQLDEGVEQAIAAARKTLDALTLPAPGQRGEDGK